MPLRLGLGPALEAKVTATERSRFRRIRTGKTITEARLGAEAEGRYGAPYCKFTAPIFTRHFKNPSAPIPALS